MLLSFIEKYSNRKSMVYRDHKSLGVDRVSDAMHFDNDFNFMI
jgi:hypothetical protein